MNDKEKRTYDRLLEKSREAFLLAIELYNRPTIKYHVEGCSFFLCNAWELMLKAFLINRDGEESVYYKGKNRTLSLDDCLKKVYTNENDPVRVNLSIVNDLRNTSTHYVTEEYELFYGPVLQTCVSDYDTQLKKLHGLEISDDIPENYLSLSVRRGAADVDEIRARYSPEVVEKMLSIGSNVLALSESAGLPTYITEFRMTKKDDADFLIRIDPDSDKAVSILKSLTNPNDKYIYRAKSASKLIDAKLKKNGIKPWVKGIEKDRFNHYHFGIFVDFYEMKGNERFAYNFSLKGEQASWGYSQQAIDLMIQEMERDPRHVIDGMREELTKRRDKK